MERRDPSNTCPRCGSHGFKPWSELSDDDKFVAERMTISGGRHDKPVIDRRVCTRCWFEETEPTTAIA